MSDELNNQARDPAAPDDDEDLLAGLTLPARDFSHLDGEFPVDAAPAAPSPAASPFVHVSRRSAGTPAAAALPSPPTREDVLALVESLAPMVAAPAAAPPPAAAAAPAAASPADEGIDIDDDLSIDVDDPVSQSAYAGVPVLLADPQQGLEGPVAKSLQDYGFACTVVETGEAARTELDSGCYPLCVLMTGADATWARLLLVTGRQRWANVRFVGGVPGADAAAVQSMVEAGALDVLEPPYPTGVALLARLHAVLPERIAAPGMPPAELQQTVENAKARLRQTADEVAARANPPPAPATPPPAPAATPAGTSQDDAALRQQLAAMEANLHEAATELGTLKLRNLELAARAGAAPAGAAGPAPAGPQVEMLKAYIKTLEDRAAREREELARLRARNDELEHATSQEELTPYALSASYHESTYEVAMVEVRELLNAQAAMMPGVDAALTFLTTLAGSAGSHAAEAVRHIKLLRTFQNAAARTAEKVRV